MSPGHLVGLRCCKTVSCSACALSRLRSNPPNQPPLTITAHGTVPPPKPPQIALAKFQPLPFLALLAPDLLLAYLYNAVNHGINPRWYTLGYLTLFFKFFDEISRTCFLASCLMSHCVAPVFLSVLVIALSGGPVGPQITGDQNQKKKRSYLSDLGHQASNTHIYLREFSSKNSKTKNEKKSGKSTSVDSPAG